MPTSLQPNPHWHCWCFHYIRDPPQSVTYSRRTELCCRCNIMQELLACMPVHTWYCHIIIFTPLIAAGGTQKMISSSVHSRQPLRQPWTGKCLVQEWAIALGQHHTLQGCKCRHAIPTFRKHTLTLGDLETVINNLGDSTDYDDHLFTAQLLTGFFTLFCLGKMMYPDDPQLRDPRKVTKRNSVQLSDTCFQFFLPGHKADRFFEGNKIIVQKDDRIFDPHKFFTAYLHVWDEKFSQLSPLAYKQRCCTNALFLYQTLTLIFQFRHWQTISVSWRCHITCRKWGSPFNYSSHQKIGIQHFQNLHMKKPCFHPGLLFGQTARTQCSFIHALESWPIFTDFFSNFLQTFSRLTLLFNRLFLNHFNPRLPMDMDLSHQYGLTFLFLLTSSPCSSHRPLHDLITQNLFHTSIGNTLELGACHAWFLIFFSILHHTHVRNLPLQTSISPGAIGWV